MGFKSKRLTVLMVLFFIPLLVESCKRHTNLSGVNPTSTDLDADGIPDAWESSGFEIQFPDGSKEMLTSSPKHKDIYVFVAWMQDSTHTHRPDPDAINTVINSFADSPVADLDGTTGIRLHVILAHQPVPEQSVLGSFDDPDTYNWSQFDAIKASVFPHLTRTDGPQLAQIMHFCLFAHNYSPDESSGLTKSIPGRDFIVSLGGFTNQVGTPAMQAGTFMHELGHALGLRHGGYDDYNYKPNYLSIMNYFFQMGGVQMGGNAFYSYSSFRLDADERALQDSPALTSDSSFAGYGTNFYCPITRAIGTILSITSSTDWTCDGVIKNNISADINNDGEIIALPGRNDWSTLQLALGGSSTGGVQPTVKVKRQIELTPATANGIKLFPVGGVSAKRNDGEVVIAWHPKPLGQVLSYIVSRKAVGDSQTTVIGRTGKPLFVDTKPAAGGASYLVSAVYAPYSYQNQTMLIVKPSSEVGFQHLDMITHKAELSRIQKSSPEVFSKFRAMGLTNEGTPQVLRPLPTVLLQTDPSQPVIVK
ncbi:hypothetical protein [Granulicella sp. S156]|uniref:hypothetical protein n=1 Tax=Granulicella sp. S156 TaxID=1747224 RepID=UPI00131D5453|nr:hypothetical protein [Granulicella sp. S156]